jgi:tryptophan synthase alpha chain
MTTTTAASRVQRTFHDLRAGKQIALMPFVTAGYPTLDATAAIFPELQAAGASLVEIGFPFSDPIADGPTIQESYTKVLAAGLQLKDIFRTIKQARPTVTLPIVGMVSYSIVFRYGLDRFLAEAKESGFDGLILPDLPPPEAQSICAKVNAAGLDTVLLVAPTTTPARRKEIADLCTGFIYYLSVSGITGERKDLPADIQGNLTNLRSLTDKPICVGFGISQPHHVAQLAPYADGAIVGAGFVRRITQHAAESPAQIAKATGAFCRELLSQVR